MHCNKTEKLKGWLYIRMKPVADRAAASILLFICAPLFLIIAVLIKADSQGKIIFSQERLGLRRKPFTCYKFRTMFENAEKESGPVWACDNDLRLTKLRKFLRKTWLDELPQLWNIVKGDLSFVGPRPIREHFINQIARGVPFYERRFSIRPGLSGWAQVHECSAVPTAAEALRYEIFYIEHRSLALDGRIILRTAAMLLKRVCRYGLAKNSDCASSSCSNTGAFE